MAFLSSFERHKCPIPQSPSNGVHEGVTQKRLVPTHRSRFFGVFAGACPPATSWVRRLVNSATSARRSRSPGPVTNDSSADGQPGGTCVPLLLFSRRNNVNIYSILRRATLKRAGEHGGSILVQYSQPSSSAQLQTECIVVEPLGNGLRVGDIALRPARSFAVWPCGGAWDKWLDPGNMS